MDAKGNIAVKKGKLLRHPLADCNIILSTITSALEACAQCATSLTHQRRCWSFSVRRPLQLSPLVGDATHTQLTLVIDGFSTLAIKRRVRVADDVKPAGLLRSHLSRARKP